MTALDLDLAYREHRHVVAGYLRRLWPCATPADIEDLVQDTYLLAYRHADSYADRGYSPLAWLCRIARNTLYDHRRRASTRPILVGDEELRTRAATTDAGTDRQHDALILAAALEQIPSHYADAVRAHHYGGGVPSASYEVLKKRRYHGYRHLRAILAGSRS